MKSTPRARPARQSKKSKPAKKAKAKQAKRAEQPSLPTFKPAKDPALLLAGELLATQGGSSDDIFVAGLDEAGRGPLAGPVVAAACVLPVPLPPELSALNDSKQLTPGERDALYPLILRHALAFGVGVVETERIDAINILRASLEAMAVAFERCQALLGKTIHGAVVDGNMRAPLHDGVVQRTVVSGDALSRPIMAASILAKVTRDRRMQEEHERFPGYGFAQHKGYGTPQHLEALTKLGACPLHRRSFAPVRAALGGADISTIAAMLPGLVVTDAPVTDVAHDAASGPVPGERFLVPGERPLTGAGSGAGAE